MATFTSLDCLLSDELAPLFWPPKRTQSAWGGHVKFAHWLIHVARPRLFVELGTHTGVSYSAFCEAVKWAGLETRCFAVDTWKGDKHAGFYPEEIFEDFRKFHDENFEPFSNILRATFDEAVNEFDDGSIDVIHFDGLHTYDAVRHDFETWLPKLSNRAVALFHDTNERREDFGVWRLWSELQQRYPSFEFLHSHGLGVLCVGSQPPAEVLALCSLEAADRINTIRNRFDSTSANWSLAEKLVLREKTSAHEIALRDAKILEQRNANETLADQMRAQADQMRVQDDQIRAQADQVRVQDDQIRAQADQVRTQTDQLRTQASQIRAQDEQITALDQKLKQALGDIEKIRNSRSWRIAAPLRFLATRARWLGQRFF